MRITTDHHDEFVARMDCEHCMVTTTISTFSPFFSQLLMLYASTHALCETGDGPDLNAMVNGVIDLRSTEDQHSFIDSEVERATELIVEKRRSAIRERMIRGRA